MFICNNLPSPREKWTHLRKLYQKQNSFNSFLPFSCICLYANSCGISAKNTSLFWLLRCKEHHYKQSLQSCSFRPATIQKSPSGTLLQGLDELSVKLCTHFSDTHCEFSKFCIPLLWPGVTLSCVVSIFVWWESSVSSFKRLLCKFCKDLTWLMHVKSIVFQRPQWPLSSNKSEFVAFIGSGQPSKKLLLELYP